MCCRCAHADCGRHVAGDRRRYKPRASSTLRPAAPSSSRSARSKTRDWHWPRSTGAGLPTLPLMGKNLIAHLRSNLVIRVPRAAISGLSAATNELQTAALFVKGRATRQNGDLLGRFHLQISASGGGNTVGAEDELFRKVPDVDFFDQLRTSTDTHVAIAIRGLGEMEPADPTNPGAHPSRVDLESRTDEYGVRRASVMLTPTQRDQRTLGRHGCGDAEGGGDIRQRPAHAGDPEQSRRARNHASRSRNAVDGNRSDARASRITTGRFHHTENLYAAGPALFPSIGSPNPMLTGIALARRTGDRIMTPPAFTADAGFQALFDGLTHRRLDDVDDQQPARARRSRRVPRSTRRAGGACRERPRPAVAHAADARPLRIAAAVDDDGARTTIPACSSASRTREQQGYDNTAYVGVNFGFEIQIDELARPDNAPIHRTGAIYSFKGPTDGPLIVHPVGEWNRL